MPRRFSVYQLGRGSAPVVVVSSALPLVTVCTDTLLSAVALLQQRIERPRGLAFAALRPAGFGRRRPCVDVEMQPALGGGHEAFEEQRADDRAGHAAGRDV